MIAPPVWTSDQLEEDRQHAEKHFRDGRYTEPLEAYLGLFDDYRGIVEEVLEETVDLTRVDEHALELLTNPRKREVFRYLTGPPVSEDDLKVLMEARSISPARLRLDPDLVVRMVNFLRDWHDRRRFPWINESWEPTEQDRAAAVLATTALMAVRRLETMRRSEGKTIQEALVATKLRDAGFEEIKPRSIGTLSRAPRPGQFCTESRLGGRKADFVIGLFDGRTMPLECKVSNSSTNSVKRLNNDAAIKAEVWIKDFGTRQMVPAAVLSGVYNLHNLVDAQDRGLTLFWTHNLQAMLDWIAHTRSS